MPSILAAILEGKITVPEEQLLRVLGQAGIAPGAGGFRVLILRGQQEISSVEEYERCSVYLPRVCGGFFQKRQLPAAIQADTEGRVIAILQDPGSREALDGSMQALQRYLDAHQLGEVVLSVGKPVRRAQDILQSYENALSALQNERLYSGNPVLYSDDLQQLMDATYLESTVNLDRILQAFRDGEMDQLRMLVALYAEKVRGISGYHSERHHPTSIRRMFIELTVYVLHITADMGIHVDALLEGLDPYTYLMNIGGGTPVIIDWFVSLCEKLRGAIDEKRESKEDLLLSRACAYIDDHLTEYDLSLPAVSREVNVSSSYFSRLFRKKKEVGFAQYIVQRRIEQVKDRLRNTALSMEEIARETGFSSASYMGRQFKKYTGVTPHSFRYQSRDVR